MAIKCFIFVVLFTLSDTQKRLVLHSDQDIDKVLSDIKQEISATKQENLALKTQMTQEIQAVQNNMTQEKQALESRMLKENLAMKAQMTQEIKAVQNNMTQEKQALESRMLKENLAMKAQMAHEIQVLNAQLINLQKGHGSTYVRWGRTVCDGNGTEKIYSGFAAGTRHDSEGGAASYICLPQTPTWAQYTDGLQDIGGQVFGTEYETGYSFQQKAFGKDMQDQDAPCVVCHSPRSATIMIPGSTNCSSGWALEYTGYLMTGHSTQQAATDYACVDKNPEAVYHGEANTNGKLFYFTEVSCGTLPCQEYPQGRELACVVCSK